MIPAAPVSTYQRVRTNHDVIRTSQQRQRTGLVVRRPQPALGRNQLIGHVVRDYGGAAWRGVVRHDGIANTPPKCHLCVAGLTFNA